VSVRRAPPGLLPLSHRERVARQRRVRVGACGEVSRSVFRRSELARDRSASLLLVWDQEPEQELSSRPSGGPSYFSLLAQREVTKRKGTPASRPPGILPSGFAIGLRVFAAAHPCAGAKMARIVRATLRADPPAARRLAGAPLRGHRGRAERAAPLRRRDHAPARGAAKELRKRHCAPFPCVAPSNAAADRGKARMSEAMDGRVRAGRSVASSAGHGARAASDARQSGRLSLGYFSLARRAAQERGRTPKAARRAAGRMPAVQREVTRAGRRPDRNALDLPSARSNGKPKSAGRQQAGSYSLQTQRSSAPKSHRA
jgi:hypothetical protein